MYDPAMVQPMREELTSNGVKELLNSANVEEVMKDGEGSVLLFVNSVCGCAAGQARPGLVDSLQNDILPDKVCTVFAGMEKDAVDQARSYFVGYPPSSPSLAVFKDGEMVHFLQRSDFLNQSAESLGAMLKIVYNKYCGDTINEAIEIPSFDSIPNPLEITPQEVKKMQDDKTEFKFLDVREPNEIAAAKIEGTTAVDQGLVDEILSSWDKDTKIIITCRSGNRSMDATRFFKQNGFKNTLSMAGGIIRWAEEIDPSIPAG